MTIDFGNWYSEIKILIEYQIPQPGLSGAHFFALGKARQKIAGTEDGNSRPKL
ncbi:hypothetical protein SAMN04488097_1792 [Epilithonimonas lactis]|nr:hypothetical protein SAMN04488097_1792 [Epilithonimonas lactis]